MFNESKLYIQNTQNLFGSVYEGVRMDKNQKMKISIVTVTKNCGDSIEKTIKSVINQTYPEIEYLIIDGGSTDNTKEIIEKYHSNIDFFISENDYGTYDAMNKGLKFATGELVHFLNGGDLFYNNNVIEEIIEIMNKSHQVDIIYGDCILYDQNENEFCSGYRSDIVQIISRGICHQTIFSKMKVFEKCGQFDINYRIFADLDWLLRSLICCHCSIEYIPKPIVYYLRGGLSDTQIGQYQSERINIILKYATFSQLIRFALSDPKEFGALMKIRLIR